MVIRLSSAGIRLAGFWLFLGGALLGGVFFWFSPFMGILAWILAFLFFLYCLLCYLPGLEILIDDTELCIRSGFVFPCIKRIPLRALCGVVRYSSPLSRAMGCQSLLLYAGGGLACLLPALSMADADAITCLLQGGQP